MAIVYYGSIVEPGHQFLNRHEELGALERLWESDRAEFMVIFGRRRVGKSALITHFAGDSRRALYFEAAATEPSDNLVAIGAEIAALAQNPLREADTNWRGAFASLHDLAQDHRTLIVLDEYQFIAAQEPGIGSLVNRLVEGNAGNPNLKLVIAGSDVSFFRDEVMGYGAVTYGRRTGSLQIAPFRFRDALGFMPNLSAADQVRAFAVFGGMPYYLSGLWDRDDLGEALLEEVLLTGARLREEPRFLLAQEGRIRDSATYMSILVALAAGLTRSNEIAQRVGVDGRLVKRFLDALVEMELVERRFPVTDVRPGRTATWTLTDPFMRFWFRFMATFGSRLITEIRARRYRDHVMAQLDEFTAEPFEEICRQWLEDSNVEVVRVGSWWGNMPVTDGGRTRNRRYEVDVCGVGDDGQVVALGSCKWTSRPHGFAELEKLRQVRDHLGVPEARLYVFSRSGFGKRLEAEAERDSAIQLIGLETLVPQ